MTIFNPWTNSPQFSCKCALSLTLERTSIILCDLNVRFSPLLDRNLCKPNPCQFGDKCVQTGQDGYQCVKNLCDPNPCHNDGRCIEVDDTNFMCACGQGYTDKLCNGMSL